MRKFTDRYIKNLKPREKEYTVHEGHGFVLRVKPSGAKSWRYVYRQDKKLCRITIGPYPEMPLAKARERYQNMHDRRKQGLPPIEPQVDLSDESVPTLAEVADEYIEQAKAKKAEGTWREDERIFRRDIAPTLGGRPPAEVRRGDVTALLNDMAHVPGSANNAFKTLRKIYNWAVKEDRFGLETSPCFGLSQPTPDTKKDRFLTSEEIHTFWHLLEKSRMSWAARSVLRLILITGQRPGECAGLPVSEIKDDWWNLPKKRAKNKTATRIYLTSLATETMALEFPREYVFPAPKKKNPTMRVASLGYAVRRMIGLAGVSPEEAKLRKERWPYPPFTPHDLRRTCATHLAKLGFPQEVIEAVLNHARPGVAGIYNRYSYDTEKKRAMLAWEEKLRRILKL